MLLAGGIVLAQKGERSNRGMVKDLSPEQIATLQMKKATLALDLTDSQQKEMKAFLFENAKMRKTKIEERKALKESGDTKERTSEEKFERANERLDHQIAQKTKLKQILSEEQFEKWQKMRQRKGKRRKGIVRKRAEKRDRN